MAQLPFVGQSYNLRRRPHSVQRTVNMIPVPMEPGNERTGWVFKDAPGLTSFISADSAGLRITEDGHARLTEAGADRMLEG